MIAREAWLTVLALVAGGTPSLLVVAASMKLAPMPLLFWAVAVPGMLVLLGILVYARWSGLDRLYNRLWVGVVGGVVLTMALDVVRVAGVHLGYLPDSVTMFGNMIAGAAPMSDPSPLSYFLGAAYHFFNGISFAVIYSVLFGRTRWWGPVLFSVVFVESAMMLLPPMALKFGPFGLDAFGTLWNGYFLDTLLAHAAMGVALGAVIQTSARYRGILLRPLGCR
ncbi:hypothetical protein KTU01_25360 [Kocuria turfanensis]|uniref:Uncharacterized protein n=2 Tax=Kocuria turfanensis TaxID=388357 RepID=A0A512IFD3_9MICC|nr:hypothetical protein KTU01_25360 [Kocuria turfanensis]